MEINVDVEIYDIINCASKSERRKLFEELIDEFGGENYFTNIGVNKTPGEEQFKNNLAKLHSFYFKMSNEDIGIIELLSKKY